MGLDPPSNADAPDVPTAYQLRAALAAGTSHSPAGLTPEAVVLGYARLATDGLYSLPSLWLGDTILRRAGLLADSDGRVAVSQEFVDLVQLPESDACDELLARYLTAHEPLWLGAAATGTSLAWELVPDDEARRLATVIPDLEQREAFLLAVARKVDPERDKLTGDVAEEFVAGACRTELIDGGRADLADRVRRVSLVSDQLGYDIVAPRVSETDRRIEVKGTRSEGPGFSVTLSRGEARQALRDDAWSLVACRVGPDDSVTLLGWCPGADLAPFLPTDPEERGRWQSVEIALDEASLVPGLPA